MKKSLLALAVLGAFTGAAYAQSSVTLFGIVDQSVNYVKNGGTHTTTLASNQLNSNRLGFRGVEDLGGRLGDGPELDELVQGVGPEDELPDGDAAPAGGRWRDGSVDPGAVRQPRVHHGA